MKNEKTCCQNAELLRKRSNAEHGTHNNCGRDTPVRPRHVSAFTNRVQQHPTFCHQNDDNKIQTRMRKLSNVADQRMASWRRQSHGSVKPNNTAMNVTWRRMKINMYNVQSRKPKLADQMHLQHTDILPSRGRLVLSMECSRTSCDHGTTLNKK